MVKKRTVIHDRKSKKVSRQRKYDGFLDNLFGGETIESLKSQRDKLKKQLEDEKMKRESKKKADIEKKKLEDETKRSKEIDKLLEDEQKQQIKNEIATLKRQIKDIQSGTQETRPTLRDEKMALSNDPNQNIPDIQNTKTLDKIEDDESTTVSEIAASVVLVGGFITGVVMLFNNKD
jgi:chromosome segregation ATPase